MKIYQPLPADGRRMTWNRWDGTALESIDVRWDNEAWTIASNMPERRADYVIRASPFWQPRQFLLFRDLDQPDLWLGTDGNDRWGEVNGAHRPDLDSMRGIFVDDSLPSLALPILRLDLDVGEHVEIPLAHVDTASLGVTPTVWRFARVDSHRWQIERFDPGPVVDNQPGADKTVDLGQDDAKTADPSPRPISPDQLPASFVFDVDEFGLPLDVDEHCRRQPEHTD